MKHKFTYYAILEERGCAGLQDARLVSGDGKCEKGNGFDTLRAARQFVNEFFEDRFVQAANLGTSERAGSLGNLLPPLQDRGARVCALHRRRRGHAFHSELLRKRRTIHACTNVHRPRRPWRWQVHLR